MQNSFRNKSLRDKGLGRIVACVVCVLAVLVETPLFVWERYRTLKISCELKKEAK
jgi:hypothetical protein